MYLDFPSVFEAAWNNYALFGTSSDLASYKLVPGLVVTEGLVETLGDSLRAYFSSQAKGEHYQVFWSENAGGAVLRIDHGLHMQTLRFWDDGRPRYQSLRPAKDDVVFYERTAGLLHVRASLDADRDEYLRLFARDIAGDEELAKVASSQPLYTLMPLALGRFSFAGDSDQVTSVDLRHLRLTLDLNPPTVISVTSRDALASLASLRPLSLSSGAPLEARFRFNLWPGGSRTTSVTVSVKPPSRTRITQAKYGEIIDRYLEAQGVRIP